MGQLQIVALIAFSCVLGGFTAGWKVNSWKHSADRELEARVFTESMEAAAKEIAKIEVKNVTIRQEVQGKLIERIYYRDCKHEPDVMQLINKAISGEPLSDSELSKITSTKGQ